MTAIETVRDALSARGSRIEAQTSDRFMAQCPSHEDGRPSLSVRQGDRGALLWCFAGCSSKDIAADLGLTVSDLFDADRIDYRYRDLSGKVVRTVKREPTKDFKQSGKTKWEQGTAPLYSLPEVVQAVKDGRPVYFVEGEKDVETLRLCGVVATTTAGGASNPHLSDFGPLRGAEVLLLPDNDPEGGKYAAKVTDLLGAVDAHVQVLAVKAGKDFSDHYAAGFTVEQLEHVKSVQDQPQDREEDRPDEWELVAVSYSEIKMKRLHWLWDRRIEKGGLAILGGVQGLGKSTICAYLAARVTHGQLEGESSGQPGIVVWVTAEEGKETAIKPRLIAAGADTSRVVDLLVRSKVRSVERPVVLPLDLEKLRRFIQETGASMVVIDPLVSVLDARMDSHNDHKVRQALGPLNLLGIDTETAIVGIMHERKSKSGSYVDRLLGSVGFTGVARSVLAVIRDPDDPDERKLCLGVAKGNNAAKGTPTLSFVLESATVTEGDTTTEVGRAVCLGEIDQSVNDLMAETDDPVDREERDEAAHWLRAYLLDRGGEAPASDLRRDCQKDGISWEVLKKRKKRLHIRSEKKGYQGPAMWVLPEAQTEEGPPAGKVADLQDDREESRPPTPDLCEVNECSSAGVQIVPLDGKRWNLCTVHATDPALPFTLGGQRTLMEGETA